GRSAARAPPRSGGGRSPPRRSPTVKSRSLVLSLAAGLLLPAGALLSGCANSENEPVVRGDDAAAPTETGPMGPGMQQGWVPGGIQTVALRSGEQFIREAG